MLALSYSLKLQHRDVSVSYQCLYKVRSALTENHHRLPGKLHILVDSQSLDVFWHLIFFKALYC